MTNPASSSPAEPGTELETAVTGAGANTAPAPGFTVTRTSVITEVQVWADITDAPLVPWSRGDMRPSRVHAVYRDHHDGEGWTATAPLSGQHLRKDGTPGMDATAYVFLTGRDLEQQCQAEPHHAWALRWLRTSEPNPYAETGVDVLASLYEATDDPEKAVLDALAVTAGLIWLCPTCQDANPIAREYCRCGALRPTGEPGGGS